MHIDSGVGHHKKKATVFEYSPFPLLKTSQKKNVLGAPSTNTEGGKINRFPEKHTAYVQTHILYISVHPAAAEPTGVLGCVFFGGWGVQP